MTSTQKALSVEHAGELLAVVFGPGGTRLATGGTEGIVRVFDAAVQERIALFTGCGHISALAISPDGHRLFASGWGMGGVKVFDPDRDPRGRGVRPWLGQLAALTFDSEGLLVLGITWDHGTVESADPVDGTVNIERLLPVTNSRAWPRGDFSFSPDGRRLAAPTQSDPTVVAVWEVALGRARAVLRGSAGPVTAVAFHPDGQSLATAAVGGPKGGPVLTLWHLASGRAIQTFEAGPARVDALAFSANGRKLAAGGATKAGSGLVTVWDAETRAVLGTTDRVGLVKFLAFHPDGARLAVADIGAAKLHLWDLVTGTLITNPAPRGVSCVTFTPDQKRLAVLGYDGNVHLCDARTGDEVLVLRGFGPPPGTMGFTPRMAFSPDGSRIAAHYGLGPMLNIWDVGPGSGLAAEPQAHNLAGWLRKSRALADRGDGPGAEVAYRHARELDGRDPSPWIEHAVSLWRHGDSPQAGDALARALVSLPDDLGRYSDLGRLLERFGRTSESETVLAKARSLLERRLSHTPDDEETAAILADLLPDTGAGGGWTVLQPDAPTSAGGATLTRLPDGSVLAGGLSPAADTYTVEAVTSLAGITGLRLEVLPDASLPAHGPGRGPKNGNFALDTIRLSADLEPRGPARYRVPLTRARADYSSLVEGVRGVIGAIDEDSGTCWTIWPRTGRAHRAVFQTAEPLGAIAGTRLRVELTFRSRWLQHALGRFRLSVTNRPLPLFETSLTKIKADEERNGLTRLGAAYYLEDKWASAADVLERAAARPEARALDRFLLALAHHHIGRPDVARADCDHALKRLRNDRADDETRDVPAEALVTIRGLSIGEAESLVLDVVFPANAFAP